MRVVSMRIVAMLGLALLAAACAPARMDLEQLSFSQGYKDVLKDLPLQVDSIEPATALPLAYSYTVDCCRFGDVPLKSSPPDALMRSNFGVYVNNIAERKTVGLRVVIEDREQGEAALKYLESKYGKPQVLSPEPKPNESGVVRGYSSYAWNMEPRLLLTRYYETQQGLAHVGTTIYRIDGKARTPDGELAVDRLVRTLKP